MHFMGSIHALEHASIGLMPLMVMADRNDFGGISTPMHAQLGLPAVFVYDGLPGGAGLCRSAFPRLAELFAAVLRAFPEVRFGQPAHRQGRGVVFVGTAHRGPAPGRGHARQRS